MNKDQDKNKSNTEPRRLRDIEDKEERKRIYREARADKTKYNKSITASANNLKPINERSEEEQREIRRKGAEAVNKLKGERKNAKQILEQILPIYANINAIKESEYIPKDLKDTILNKKINITQYDLVMMAMLYKAQNGDVKASEYIRDTYGDKPVNEVHNVNETITEADKELINKLSKRLNIVDVN